MKAIRTLLASTCLVAAALPSMADTLTIDFENAVDPPEKASNHYAGAVFSDSAWVAQGQGYYGGGVYGNFMGPGDNKGALTLNTNPNSSDGKDNSFTIKTDHAFTGFFSLIFGGEASASLVAYGANGEVLSTPSSSGLELCDGLVCNWAELVLDLKGLAITSFEVKGVNGKLWFDDISFTDAIGDGGNTGVPEPGGVVLSLAALGALAWSRKRSS